MNENSENLLVEQPTIALFNELGYKTVNAFKGRSQVEPKSMLGRETAEEVVLVRELLKALQRLNPTLPLKALQLASAELTRSRAMLTPHMPTTKSMACSKTVCKSPMLMMKAMISANVYTLLTGRHTRTTIFYSSHNSPYRAISIHGDPICSAMSMACPSFSANSKPHIGVSRMRIMAT